MRKIFFSKRLFLRFGGAVKNQTVQIRHAIGLEQPVADGRGLGVDEFGIQKVKRLQGGDGGLAIAHVQAAVGGVEEIEEGVLFNDALLYQQEDQTKQGQGRGRQASVSIEYAGSSQMFANIFEDVDERSGEVQKARSKGFANFVAHAIDVYETNIQLIQGIATPRGTNLSLRL